MEVKNQNIVYCLKCPFTGEVHYVGKSTRGMLRPTEHLTKSHSKKIAEWVSDISLLGYQPIIEILDDNISIDELDIRERFFIDKFIDGGSLLFNESGVSYGSIVESQKNKIGESDISADDKLSQDIVHLVKTKRKQLKITQPDFALKLGLGLRWLRKVESGNINIMLPQLTKLLFSVGMKIKIVRITD